ncbi:hypothetical protein [Amycolatopsis dongchuanensis]|uniref:hypothetical protein n=1 Tax=Amycolatopsis TaxID=1813 RepID=UPI0031F82AA9
MTSVDDVAVAAPIVSALNRVSAYAALPVSVYGNRYGRFDSYPNATSTRWLTQVLEPACSKVLTVFGMNTSKRFSIRPLSTWTVLQP